jgi:hypothetical protein
MTDNPVEVACVCRESSTDDVDRFFFLFSARVRGCVVVW